MHLLDSDTLTYLYEDHPRVVRRLRALDPGEVVATTIISKIEVLQGRHAFVLKASRLAEFLRAQDLLVRTEQFLARVPIVFLDAAAIRHFEGLRKNKGLRKIGRADLLIAASALAQRAILVTRNLRHIERIPGLHVVNWVD